MIRTLIRGFSCVALVTLVFGAAGSARAGLIDFEAFADTQNLHGVNLGGVTLTAPFGSVEVFDDRFGVSFKSATNAVANFFPVGSPSQDNPLTGVFDSAVSLVSLWAGDGGFDTDSWTLSVFDAQVGGNLLGSTSSGFWTGSPYRQITHAFPNILRFEATFDGTSSFGIGFDDLFFEPATQAAIPEPSTLVLWSLGAVGLAGLGWRRRKRAA